MGVLHGDEIDYVFGNPLNESRSLTLQFRINSSVFFISLRRHTEDEAELSRRIIKHYAHFARYGLD